MQHPLCVVRIVMRLGGRYVLTLQFGTANHAAAALYCRFTGERTGSAEHVLLPVLPAQVPLNVWLPWLPQLQTSLQRPEAALVKDLLQQLAATYPQAIYYGLRTILLCLREARALEALLSALFLFFSRLGAHPCSVGCKLGAALHGLRRGPAHHPALHARGARALPAPFSGFFPFFPLVISKSPLFLPALYLLWAAVSVPLHATPLDRHLLPGRPVQMDTERKEQCGQAACCAMCAAQAAVKAVHDARMAARTNSGGLPATPSILQVACACTPPLAPLTVTMSQ
jgi:hypothetical protein